MDNLTSRAILFEPYSVAPKIKVYSASLSILCSYIWHLYLMPIGFVKSEAKKPRKGVRKGALEPLKEVRDE